MAEQILVTTTENIPGMKLSVKFLVLQLNQKMQFEILVLA